MAKNPILDTPAGTEVCERFAALDPAAREAVRDFCGWLYEHARVEAERSWARSKAPMAVYWKAVAAWSYHLRRAVGNATNASEVARHA